MTIKIKEMKKALKGYEAVNNPERNATGYKTLAAAGVNSARHAVALDQIITDAIALWRDIKNPMLLAAANELEQARKKLEDDDRFSPESEGEAK